MALSKIGLLAVRGTRGLAKRIADQQGVSKQAISVWLETNSPNLTRIAVLDLIIKETELSKEDLLEKETIEEPTR